jgi:hypothetical protein
MKMIRRWIQILAYKSWGISWRAADYRRELLGHLQVRAKHSGLPITITANPFDIHVQLGFLNVDINKGNLPPLVIRTFVLLTDLAAIGQEYPREAYMRFKSETRFNNLVDPKTIAGLILQQAGQVDLILRTGSARNVA